MVALSHPLRQDPQVLPAEDAEAIAALNVGRARPAPRHRLDNLRPALDAELVLALYRLITRRAA
jgi:hypothetical protein